MAGRVNQMFVLFCKKVELLLIQICPFPQREIKDIECL
jgi:hypothetical protein